jgi:hypothetical protein
VRKVAPAAADGFTQAAAFLRKRTTLVVCALVLALSVATVYDQVRGLIPRVPYGDPYAWIETRQVFHLEQVVNSNDGDPWVYRVGSAWLALRARDVAKAAGFGQPGTVGLLAFKLLENIGIFALAWLLYRRLGASRYASALGLALIAWAFTQAQFNSGLSFDTYGDVLVYLAAALLILSRRYAWVLPLTVVGALNRETSGLVPVMLMASAVPLGLRTTEGRRVAALGAAALGLFAVTYLSVRVAQGPHDLIIGYGNHPGWEAFEYNVGRGQAWDFIFRTVTIVPLLALTQWRHWPVLLRAFAVAVVPAWLVIHLLASSLDETRLLLVPYVLVFVPGALAGLRSAAVNTAPAS